MARGFTAKIKAVTAHPFENIAVADAGAVKRQPVIGEEGLGPGQLYEPAGVALDDEGNLLVVDHGNHRGVVLTPDGAFVRAFGSKLYVRPAMRPDAGEGGR